ncbi:SPOR domain-containing protein [Paenibacillus mendelii]|uniref:SPOR domain-containing protein n=1 Tax=Paenibacillus mendelii TaxID=206163 RepID=A0ABV6JBC2_9BACL|nr:SPOR domain-containing protein [Paenibacillus mendelii]MCQ6560855.1 SPOR domain-containing protein [Paenibacillus mendelii]
MNSKARITYRFDKNNGSRMERKPEPSAPPVKSNVVPFFQEELKFTSEIGTWNSPFQDDAHALEQLIRDTEREKTEASAANNHRQDEPRGSGLNKTETTSITYKFGPNTPNGLPLEEEKAEDLNSIPLGDAFDGYGPGTDLYRGVTTKDLVSEGPVIDPELDPRQPAKGPAEFHREPSYRTSRGPSWYKVFASVTGAVATGAVFGYLVLTLFTGGGSPGESNVLTEPAGSSAIVEPGGKGNGNAGSGNATAGGKTDKPQASGADDSANPTSNSGAAVNSVAIQVPQSDYYMLQYGVFSNKEGMDNAIAELKEKGLAAASLTTGEDFRVYIGMAADQSNALMLSQLLADREVYMKLIEVPALAKFPFAGEASAAQTFLNQTRELIHALSTFTSANLGEQKQEAGDWKEAHQKWTRERAGMEAGIKDQAGIEAFRKLGQALNNAAVAASEYENKASEAHLWSIQSSLMEAIFIEKTWFTSIDGL